MTIVSWLNGYADRILASAGVLIVSWLMIWGYTLYTANKRHKEITTRLDKIEEALKWISGKQ